MASSTVFVVVWNGPENSARAAVHERYPESSPIFLNKRELREGGVRGQIGRLGSLRGRALVIFATSLDDFVEPLLLACTGLVHHCRETVLMDGSGRIQRYRRSRLLWLSLRLLVSAALDALVLATAWLSLKAWLALHPAAHPLRAAKTVSLAYLYPYPFDRSAAGGAMSHIAGLLSGLARTNSAVTIVTGRRLPVSQRQEVVGSRRRWYLLRESAALSYSVRFAREAIRLMKALRPETVYQRHGPYAVSGALVSALTTVPLVLEYNGSEQWVAKHWDPCRFPGLLGMCEQISLRSAALIVVVSQALKDELTSRGIPEHRILVNPNGMDPELFHPACGGSGVREGLRIGAAEVVVGFVGTFSYWHGISVLREVVLRLLNSEAEGIPSLRFLFVGDGPLLAETKQALSSFEENGKVIFTGIVRHEEVPAYLDACDVVVSPHVPMPDGSPFFGSPTKLFEYMAMGKAIVASALDQIAEVLTHEESALLVTPGSVAETASAIQRLARDPMLRRNLGRGALEAAHRFYTWEANANRLLQGVADMQTRAETREALPTALALDGLRKS